MKLTSKNGKGEIIVKKLLSLLVIIAVLFISLTGCASNKESKTFTSLDELKDKRIGFNLAAVTEKIANEKFPNAKHIAYNEQMEAIAALQAGQIDAAMVSYPTAFLSKKNIPTLTWIDEPVSVSQAGIGIKKGNTELLNQVNESIQELKQNGMLADMIERWYDMGNPNA